MSHQRRRGVTVKIWKTITTTDNRGTVQQMVNPSVTPDYVVRAAAVPQRSARAEVPGQAQINVVRLLIQADLEDVDLQSRIEYLGRRWDVVTPPALHIGTRQTRHWSIDIRERP